MFLRQNEDFLLWKLGDMLQAELRREPRDEQTIATIREVIEQVRDQRKRRLFRKP